jgi:hypothetical protein
MGRSRRCPAKAGAPQSDTVPQGDDDRRLRASSVMEPKRPVPLPGTAVLRRQRRTIGVWRLPFFERYSLSPPESVSDAPGFPDDTRNLWLTQPANRAKVRRRGNAVRSTGIRSPQTRPRKGGSERDERRDTATMERRNTGPAERISPGPRSRVIGSITGYPRAAPGMAQQRRGPFYHISCCKDMVKSDLQTGEESGGGGTPGPGTPGAGRS